MWLRSVSGRCYRWFTESGFVMRTRPPSLNPVLLSCYVKRAFALKRWLYCSFRTEGPGLHGIQPSFCSPYGYIVSSLPDKSPPLSCFFTLLCSDKLLVSLFIKPSAVAGGTAGTGNCEGRERVNKFVWSLLTNLTKFSTCHLATVICILYWWHYTLTDSQAH